jgi:hypothetical protein
MRKLAVWQVSKSGLAPVEDGSLELEKHLESWIAEDPSLLQAGLVIVGRQVQLDAGPLDLLGIDPQGRWVVIEIKRGALDRKAVAQVQDYAACIAALSGEQLRTKVGGYLDQKGLDLDQLLEQRGASDSLEPEQRQILLTVVGTGSAPGLERMVGFLASRHNLPISVVLFDVFKLDADRQLLAREVTQADSPPPPTGAGTVSVAAVMALARKHGTDKQLQRAVDLARDLGLYVRPYKKSLMFTPPSNGSRMLFTLWAVPEKGNLKAYVGVEPFTEFFPVERSIVSDRLGPEGWRSFTSSAFEKFLRGLGTLPLKPEKTG